MAKHRINSKKSPKVVVLILSYNGKHLLDEAVSSYLQNDYTNFKVIVIDNGSTDGTLKFVKEKYPNVRVVRTEKNLGYSGGFNLGLKHAFTEMKAEYALITNNDVKADRSVITELVKVAERDDTVGFVTGKVYFYKQPNVLQTVGMIESTASHEGGHIGYKEEDTGQHDQICERFFADDVFILVTSSVYHDTGGYDTLFFLQSENHDWQLRAKKLGYRIFYTPYAKIWHKVSMTIGETSAEKAYYDARNPMLVILLHKSPEFFRKYLRSHLRRRVFRSSLVALKQGNMTKALAKWQGFFSGINWGLRNRKFGLRHFL